MARQVRNVLAWIALLLGLLALASHYLTPWPGVLLVRAAFARGAAQLSAGLEKHVPAGVRSRLGIVYDPADPDARLDIFTPGVGTRQGPTIVWVHGGGYVAGDRSEIANYLKVLAGQGFGVVAVGYSIAPERTYPTPVRQVNAALGFLGREGRRLGVDPDRIIVAGDSAGAQIAAQVANLVTAPAYARAMGIAPAIGPDRLRGAILFCGPYDGELLGGPAEMSWFMRTTSWAYSGRRDHRDNPQFRLMSITTFATPAFPPAFVSAGNGDPLLPHSLSLARALRGRGVPVDSLFFPGHEPPLPHLYQFDLDVPAGREALRRALAFARRVGGEPAAVPAQ
ncbi:alpha/beta hydrolase [Sphingosinicella terrae]|uniref:alpha/beta hydrolase n=1 Tax=Sphingosinicella terrae TaxID=2172047 RepID=UPI000E0D8FCD|nr:alpha/beta hydrolase [Sphingosinicella terrae]